MRKIYVISLVILRCCLPIGAQNVDPPKCFDLKNNIVQVSTAQPYWNTKLQIVSYRLPPAPIGYKPEYIDLDHDGDPDILKTVTINNTPVMWIDDDDDMKYGDLEGDTDSDCLLIDRNRDGKYGGMSDLIIDWVDNNKDGKADMQVIVDYPAVRNANPWPDGHYMWVLDTDLDQVFNYIDWNTFQLKAWDHNGLSDFFLDYSGRSMFMKIHVPTYTMENLKLNWENPFLFYDPDHDGLTEMAIRLVDSPQISKEIPAQADQYQVKFKGTIDWVSIAVDMDNDNAPGNDFDYDFSINFRGKGFNYMDQVHKFSGLRGLPATDTCFMDPRWRQLDELIYAGHDQALPLIFNGDWNKVYFVYDEDDDCNRWERVEFLDPLNPFKVGTGKGGLDNNGQSDPSGDRGEWDLDNSGKGKLYLSRFDGRLHLYGAEWGCWRIDQTAQYYQGWDRKFLNKDPQKFATIKYTDTDHNGFMDKIQYDMDGDTLFEETVNLKDLHLSDTCNLIDISRFKYQDYVKLQKKMSDQLWSNAMLAVKVSNRFGLNTSWYAKLLKASSTQEKYTNGYWLQFYLFKDLTDLFLLQNNRTLLDELNRAYFGSDWKKMLKD